MKADKELFEYIEKVFWMHKELEEKYEPHTEERFQHIYNMGKASAFKDLIMILEERYDFTKR